VSTTTDERGHVPSSWKRKKITNGLEFFLKGGGWGTIRGRPEGGEVVDEIWGKDTRCHLMQVRVGRYSTYPTLGNAGRGAAHQVSKRNSIVFEKGEPSDLLLKDDQRTKKA